MSQSSLILKFTFFLQRWGDAPVHSIAAALFASSSQIQFFDQIGYEHNPYTHCPRYETSWKDGKCSCDPRRSFGEFFHMMFNELVIEYGGVLPDYDGYSCMSKWDRLTQG